MEPETKNAANAALDVCGLEGPGFHGTGLPCRRPLNKKITGRGERIRTSGLYVPNVALYQAKLHPDLFFLLVRPLCAGAF